MSEDLEVVQKSVNDWKLSTSATLTGYSDHPSVLKINETLKISPSSFKLDDTSVVDIRNAMTSTYQRVEGYMISQLNF